MQVVFAVMVSLSLLGAALFAVLVLRVIRKGDGIFGRPINMIIFFESMLLTVYFVCGALSYLIGTLSNVHLADMFGKTFCKVNMMVICLGCTFLCSGLIHPVL